MAKNVTVSIRFNGTPRTLDSDLEHVHDVAEAWVVNVPACDGAIVAAQAEVQEAEQVLARLHGERAGLDRTAQAELARSDDVVDGLVTKTIVADGVAGRALGIFRGFRRQDPAKLREWLALVRQGLEAKIDQAGADLADARRVVQAAVEARENEINRRRAYLCSRFLGLAADHHVPGLGVVPYRGRRAIDWVGAGREIAMTHFGDCERAIERFLDGE